MNKNLFSLEAEQGLVGCLLVNNDAIDEILNLKPEHFYNSELRDIYVEIVAQINEQKQADVITVGSKIKRVDIFQYLLELQHSVLSYKSAKRYAENIVNYAIKRALVAFSNDICELVATGQENGAIVDLIGSKLELITEHKTEKDPIKLRQSLFDYYSVIEKRLNGDTKLIKTGFLYVDEKLDGGLERGTLTIIAGRPAMGKSAFAVGVGLNIARENSALILSMEMSETQLNDRITSNLGDIPIKFLRKPDESEVNNQYWEKLTQSAAKAEKLKLYLDDMTGLNMMQIRAKSRKVKRKHGLDVLIIDQLSFITGSQAEKSYEAAGDYTRALIKLAKELDVVVILLCQLNRELEKRGNKRPIMSDLAMSGSIEQDASVIMFLYRDIVYNEDTEHPKLAELIIAKNRQGESGTVFLEYEGSRAMFKNTHQDWQFSKEAKREYGRNNF